jgi:hypothetical protein
VWIYAGGEVLWIHMLPQETGPTRLPLHPTLNTLHGAIIDFLGIILVHRTGLLFKSIGSASKVYKFVTMILTFWILPIVPLDNVQKHNICIKIRSRIRG